MTVSSKSAPRDIDSDIERAMRRARDAIFAEIAAIDRDVRDPESKVTRSLFMEKLARLKETAAVALTGMASDADERVTEYAIKAVEKEQQQVVDLQAEMKELQEIYACALRVLEDAGVDERDLLGVITQIDPIRVLTNQQRRQRAAAGGSR